MSRSTSLLFAAVVATAAVGCAHCDTCDDFPAPCVDCGYSTPDAVGPTMYAEGPMGPMGPGEAMPYGGPAGPGLAPNAAPAPPALPGASAPAGLGSAPAAPAIPSTNDLPPVPPPSTGNSPF